MTSQHQKIRDLLQDFKFHCTSQMRELYMADPPKRLQEMGSEVINGGKCTLHDYHTGGVKMWKLNPDYTPNPAPSTPITKDTCNGDHKCWHKRKFNYCLCEVPVKQEEVKEVTLF